MNSSEGKGVHTTHDQRASSTPLDSTAHRLNMVANENRHGNCHTKRQSYHRTDAESGAGDTETPWKRHEKAVQMLSIKPPWCHRHHKPHVYLDLSAKGENQKSDMTCPMAFACATKRRNHSSPGSVHRSKMHGWMKLCPSRFEIEPQP